MGHATDRAQSYYGHRRSGAGAVSVQAAVASNPVRAAKTLPLTLAQRLAKSEATKNAKIAARAGNTHTVSPPPTKCRHRMPAQDRAAGHSGSKETADRDRGEG